MSEPKKRLKYDPSVFHKPEPIPEAGIRRAEEIMRSGKIFRYECDSHEESEAALLEHDFAEYMGQEYAVAVNSCSSAILLALLAAGVKPGDNVLVPGFTFTAVPAAIVHAQAIPVFVECNKNYRVDVKDLQRKIAPDTKVFLLSYMRGYTSDLDEIMPLCDKHGITVIEDSAHSLGTRWNGKLTGTFGRAGCYSFQSYKAINAGEGGMITTNDPEFAVKSIYLSGAYEKLYEKHFWLEELRPYFEKHRNLFAPYNMRMDNVRAAMVRPQLPLLETKAETYRKNYAYLAGKLSVSERVELPEADKRELRVPDSLQFRLNGLTDSQLASFMKQAKEAGLPLSAFGADRDNARAFWNWNYVPNPPELPETRESIRTTCDMRLCASLTEGHLDYIAETILGALHDVTA